MPPRLVLLLPMRAIHYGTARCSLAVMAGKIGPNGLPTVNPYASI